MLISRSSQLKGNYNNFTWHKSFQLQLDFDDDGARSRRETKERGFGVMLNGCLQLSVVKMSCMTIEIYQNVLINLSRRELLPHTPHHESLLEVRKFSAARLDGTRRSSKRSRNLPLSTTLDWTNYNHSLLVLSLMSTISVMDDAESVHESILIVHNLTLFAH